jgi:uncharacterized protein YqeY
MSLKEKINNDIKEAMRAKNQAALLALRAIKSAILIVETAEGRTHAELTKEEEIQLLSRQVKQRKDSIEQFRKNNRNDLADKETAELVTIEKYLPKALSLEEVDAALKAIIAEVGATNAKEMGKVMKVASVRLAGKAEGKMISERVKALLQ